MRQNITLLLLSSLFLTSADAQKIRGYEKLPIQEEAIFWERQLGSSSKSKNGKSKQHGKSKGHRQLSDFDQLEDEAIFWERQLGSSSKAKHGKSKHSKSKGHDH